VIYLVLFYTLKIVSPKFITTQFLFKRFIKKFIKVIICSSVVVSVWHFSTNVQNIYVITYWTTWKCKTYKSLINIWRSMCSIFIKPNLSAWTHISQFTLDTHSFRKYNNHHVEATIDIICSLLVPVPKYLLSHITTMEVWNSII